MVAFKSGVGRLVWGNPGKMTPKKGDDNKPVLGEDGKPIMEIAFGVAFPKNEFAGFLWPSIQQAVAVEFPQGAPGHFAWKYVDGDAATGHRQGKPYNQREGYPGCYVMSFKTNFAIPLWKPSLTVPGQWDQIGPSDIKTGDYIAVSGDFQAHKAKTANANPGLYTNPQGVMLIGIGQAIMNAPDAQTLFGGMQYQLPPGATAPGAAPQMPGNMPGLPGQQPMPGAMPQQQYQPQPGAMPGAMPGAAPQQYQPQPQQYQPQPGAMPGAAPQQYQPAYDLTGMPQQQPSMPGNGYAPTPGGPATNPVGYPHQNVGQPGAVAPGQYMTQPAPVGSVTYPSNPQPGMPGQMPPGFTPR